MGCQEQIAKLNNTDGAVDPLWDSNINGKVSTIAVNGIIIGGYLQQLVVQHNKI